MSAPTLMNGHDENDVDQEIDLNEPSKDRTNISMDSQNRMVGCFFLEIDLLFYFYRPISI